MSVLHPQVQAVMDAMARMNLAPPHTMPVEQARAQFMRTRTVYLAPAQPVASVTDRTVPGPGGEMPIRVYRPSDSDPGALRIFHDRIYFAANDGTSGVELWSMPLEANRAEPLLFFPMWTTNFYWLALFWLLLALWLLLVSDAPLDGSVEVAVKR